MKELFEYFTVSTVIGVAIYKILEYFLKLYFDNLIKNGHTENENDFRLKLEDIKKENTKELEEINKNHAVEINHIQNGYKSEYEKLNKVFLINLETIRKDNTEELESIKTNFQIEINKEKQKLEELQSEFSIKMSYIHKTRVEKIETIYKLITLLNSSIETLLDPNDNREDNFIENKKIVIEKYNHFVYFLNDNKLYFNKKLLLLLTPLSKLNKGIIVMTGANEYKTQEKKFELYDELKKYCYPIIEELENEFRIILGVKD